MQNHQNRENQSPPSIMSLINISLISERILSFIAEGRGGHQTLLNMRKVCSLTKNWVDCLSSSQIRELFPHLQVSIFLCRRYLADFLQTPPPNNVTSLKLQNPSYVWEDGSKLTAEEHKLLRLFGSHWAQKLNTLEIRELSGDILELFCYPAALKNVRCEFMNDYSPILNQLETLSVHNLTLFDNEVSLFTQMARSKNLSNFELTGTTTVFEGLAILIDAKKHDRKFSLTANMKFHDRNSSVSFEMLKQFVCSVAASTSTICLLRLNDYTINRILKVVPDQQMLTRFFRRVKWFDFTHYNSVKFMTDFMEMFSFPNLRRFHEEMYCGRGQYIVETTDRLNLPQTLQELTICTRSFLNQTFPRSLRYLCLDGINMTILELQHLVCRTNESCPLLAKLKISLQDQRTKSIEQIESLSSEKELFPNLESLSCSISFDFEDTKTSTRILLFNILKLTTLNIQRLKLKSFRRFPMRLGLEELRLIVASNLAGSLVSHSFRDMTIEEEATGDLEKLRVIVENNAEREQYKYGRKLPKSYMHDLCNK